MQVDSAWAQTAGGNPPGIPSPGGAAAVLGWIAAVLPNFQMPSDDSGSGGQDDPPPPTTTSGTYNDGTSWTFTDDGSSWSYEERDANGNVIYQNSGTYDTPPDGGNGSSAAQQALGAMFSVPAETPPAGGGSSPPMAQRIPNWVPGTPIPISDGVYRPDRDGRPRIQLASDKSGGLDVPWFPLGPGAAPPPNWNPSPTTLEESRKHARDYYDASGRAAGEIMAGTIPGVGEAQDLEGMSDPNAPWWSRLLSGISFGVNAASAGMLPNFGGIRRGAKAASAAADTASDAAKAANKAADAVANTEEAALEAAAQGAKGEYGTVGGHHVHPKAGFKSHVNYDPQKGFSISQEYMKSRNWDHQAMTNKQRELFNELARSGRPNTLREHTRIAEEALVAGGATREEARRLVAESLRNLQQQGVRAPSGIPWNQ